jgi:hypothetical protein
MRRQAMESCAAKILATTNNPQQSQEFRPIKDDGTIFLSAKMNPISKPIELPGPNNSPMRKLNAGCWEVQIQATTEKGAQLESISFLLWPTR